MTIPTVGRIVLYKYRDGSFHPAIISNVWNDLTVNLRIFEDGADTPWASMVQYGTEPGQWSWPPKV